MYIPGANLPTGTPVDHILDVVLQWVLDQLKRLGNFIAEHYAVVLQWVLDQLKRLGNFIAEHYLKALEWLAFVGHAVTEPLRQHPYTALFWCLLTFLGPWILLLPLFLLQAFFFVVLLILGFGLGGIIGGSPAALFQSFCYGAHTPANSLFAMLQSTGAHYNVATASNGVLLTIRVLAGVLGLYVLVWIILA